MKKLTVAVLVIGTFIIYSLTHQPSNSSAFVAPTVSAGSLTNIVTPTVAAASSPPPTATTNAVVASANAQSKPTPTTQAPTIVLAPSPTPTVAPTPTVVPTPMAPATAQYKDGSYTGRVTDAQWGYVRVEAVVAQGKITSVQFLQYPSDRSRSRRINSYADPVLINEAIQAQSAQVDIVTGATDSSEAFIQSLSDALSQARA